MRSTRHLQQDLAIYAIFFGAALCADYLAPHRPTSPTTSAPLATSGTLAAQNRVESDMTCTESIDSLRSSGQPNAQEQPQQIASRAARELSKNISCESERKDKGD